MKYPLFLLLSLLFLKAGAQPQFKVQPLSLPAEVAFYNNQFSGLYIHDGKLFLMSESRLQDNAPAKLYAIKLADLDHKMTDTAYVLPFQKYNIYNLDVLRAKMKVAGQDYEGLEAMIIDGDDVYLSVETATPSSACYLLKGRLNDTAVILQTNFLSLINKPVSPDKSHIYNAGFEAIAKRGNDIVAFFEYNYFTNGNCVLLLNSTEQSSKKKPALCIPIDKVPFRITDITPVNGNHFTAINYFYKGGGADTIYRTHVTDTANSKLIKEGKGYSNYCRLIDITAPNRHNMKYTWTPLWEFPTAYMGYNWEGISAYREGYFIMNDKYTPERPYASTLLYLHKVK